ncbi:hypothetical protein GIB67_000612 [Kingdonia uniflora]|uniref:Aminotransferase-like plant mobile domain-containing protein n=1 Tax=Kingdonia uniflora TaxID=39325 RepID=A0A7J7P785_9MAGN|nr:hypothetical protein GIB67_000612 [Kingdonia uniflora]
MVYLSNARQFLPNIDSSHIKSGNVSIAHLRMYLTIAADREDDITIARDFIIFMMGHLWFQTANETIPLGYLAAVNDLDSAAQHDWVLLFFLPCTMVWIPQSRLGVPSLNLSNLLRVGHPIVKEDVKFSTYSRLRAWERKNRRKTNDHATNLFILGRYHIDHRTIEMITWEPWLDFAVSKTEDVLNAKLLSRKKMSLQEPNENCEYYLGDRCRRQVTGKAGFLDCEKFMVGEERETYATYWSKLILEVGHMLTDSQKMGNIDLFGPTVLRAGITPVVVTSASAHSLSQDFSLPGKAEGPDQGWHMEWTGRREMFPIALLIDPHDHRVGHSKSLLMAMLTF